MEYRGETHGVLRTANGDAIIEQKRKRSGNFNPNNHLE